MLRSPPLDATVHVDGRYIATNKTKIKTNFENKISLYMYIKACCEFFQDKSRAPRVTLIVDNSQNEGAGKKFTAVVRGNCLNR